MQFRRTVRVAIGFLLGICISAWICSCGARTNLDFDLGGREEDASSRDFADAPPPNPSPKDGGYDVVSPTDATSEEMRPDASGNADADVDGCVDACVVGHSRCEVGGISTCVLSAGGCSEWGAPLSCSESTTCHDDAGEGVPAGCKPLCNPDLIAEGFPKPAVYLVPDNGSWTGWGVNYGTLNVQTDAAETGTVLHHAAPSDGDTSYILVPPPLLADLSGKTAIRFDLKSAGGTYYESDYGFLGDVILKSGATVATASITHTQDGLWHSYLIPLDAMHWSVDPKSLLVCVDGLAIRAEYGVGDDDVWLGNFAIVP